MRKTLTVFLMLAAALVGVLSATAQDTTTPEAIAPTAQPPSVTASDQLSLDGSVTVEAATSPGPGWIAIHADANGQPGPTVGIAPVREGVNQDIRIDIDLLGATSHLFAVLHTDDGSAGMYEYGTTPGVDAWVLNDNQIVMAAFNIEGIRAFDQAISNGTVVVASVVASRPGWLVIHADNNGQPGPVLGQWLIPAGTTPNVTVPLAAEGQTPVLWPMLHVDDGTTGTYEFDSQSGLDAPVMLNGQVAMTSFDVTDSETLMSASGSPLTSPDNTQPFISAFGQLGMGDGTVGSVFINSVYSVTPGWIDVHADGGNHPGKSLGMVALPQGTTSGITVSINAMGNPLDPPTTLTPIVWPMLHVDDHTIGQNEFLRIPGADLPVVANGRVVTYPITINTAEITAEPTEEATATEEPTEEGTPEATEENTPEATDANTPEATSERTETPEGTSEVTETPPDRTETVEPPPATETVAPPPETETIAPPPVIQPTEEATQAL